MTTANHNQPEGAGRVAERKRAALYLRVSTPGQVFTDYDPEGISIPAQRVAGQRKAESLGADVVREFVEPGRTATSIEKRPAFQEMIAWVKAQGDIDYVVVYHFNRVFRNSVDAGITKRDLGKVGTRIVSTIIDMGEGPEASMVENILHAVDQYQSQASGADIKYKMGQKAKNGGTISTSPLGYLNVREAKLEGGEIRTVVVDPERAPLIVQAMETFATGRYPARDVLDQATAAGLRTRPSANRPAHPVSLAQFYDMLADRYYCGIITYEGQEYRGRHPKLISVQLHERVQQALALHGGGGTRHRVHHHWLKGLLWCHRCGSRLIVARGRGNGGTYFYFYCKGRKTATCTLPYLPMAKVEAAVEQRFALVRLTADVVTTLQTQFAATVKFEQRGLHDLKTRLTRQLADLDAREDKLLDLIGEDDWPKVKLQKRLALIQSQREEITGQLADTTSKLDTGRQFFTAALELLADPQAFYQRGSTSVKKAMAKLVFTNLQLDAHDPDGRSLNVRVGRHELSEGIDSLVEVGSTTARSAARPLDTTPNSKRDPIPEDGVSLDVVTEAELLAAVLSDVGSNRAALVGDTGIEPVTSSV